MTSAPHVTEKQQQRRRSDPSADPSAALFCPLKIPIFLFLSPLLFPGGGTGRGVREGWVGWSRELGGFRFVALFCYGFVTRIVPCSLRMRAATPPPQSDAEMPQSVAALP